MIDISLNYLGMCVMPWFATFSVFSLITASGFAATHICILKRYT